MPQHARRHSDKICAKTAEPIKILFELWTRVGPRKDALDVVSDPHVLDRVPVPHAKGQFLEKGHTRVCRTTFCAELCKNSRTDRDAVWVVESGGPKEACITWEHIGDTWRIQLNRPCVCGDAAFMLNHFDHLLLI